MKNWGFVFLPLLFALHVACAQAPPDDTDPYAEDLVAGTLKMNGVITSVSEKQFNRLGDRVAIGIIRVLGGEPLNQPQQAKVILRIIQDAFAAPKIIGTARDRQPKATLFLLRHLRTLPISKGLAREIDETEAFVRHATSP